MNKLTELGLNDTVDPPLVYVCAACGKRSRSRTGWDKDDNRVAMDQGWDESCFLHAVLCRPNTPEDIANGGPPWLAVNGDE